MKQLASIFRNVLRQKVSVGLLTLVILGVVGGGSAFLVSSPSTLAATSQTSKHNRVSFVSRISYAILAQKASNHMAARHVARQRTQVNNPLVSQTPSTTAAGNNTSVAGTIYQVFGPYAPSALNIARCESGLNPGAYNAASHASGIFQILYPSTWSSTPYSGYSPFNAWANINAAHTIFVRDGYSWREWQCQA
jgi:Transglycosylase SLT domain